MVGSSRLPRRSERIGLTAGGARAASSVDEASGLVVVGLSRSFGETRALNSASLRVCPGEIHSLVGENGSGKSTLIKILSGVLRPDSGTLVWEGEARQLGSPRSAQGMGIAT